MILAHKSDNEGKVTMKAKLEIPLDEDALKEHFKNREPGDVLEFTMTVSMADLLEVTEDKAVLELDEIIFDKFEVVEVEEEEDEEDEPIAFADIGQATNTALPS